MTPLNELGWGGRSDPEDGDAGLRWHQVVHEWQADDRGITVIGFASDEGVRRNLGRVGAATGPHALRRQLSNLPAARGFALCDAGDVRCTDGDLEGAQAGYANRVADILAAGGVPIGLGGGHEIAWASISGLIQSRTVPAGAKLGILNLDAHFDLRRSDQPTSGTSFRQALEAAKGLDFFVDYKVLGISESSNTRALFEAAESYNATWRTDAEMAPAHLQDRLDEVEDWLAGLDSLYLTICLDVLPAYVAPGVSAPAARGVGFDVIEAIAFTAASSGKLCLADVAELNPSLDIDHRTARSAARLIWRIARGLGG